MSMKGKPCGVGSIFRRRYMSQIVEVEKDVDPRYVRGFTCFRKDGAYHRESQETYWVAKSQLVELLQEKA